jgi:hypothetical protein
MFSAADMENGVPGSSVHGWHFWDLQNADGTPAAAMVQPAIAHGDPAGAFLVGREGTGGLTVWKVNDELQPTQSVTAVSVPLPAWGTPIDAPQKGGSTTNKIEMRNLGSDPLKVVWNHWFLYVVTNDAKTWGGSSDQRTSIRFIRLWVSGYPSIPPPGTGGSRLRIFGGSASGDPPGGTTFYGWPALEVDKDQNAIVVYARSGTKLYAQARFSAWMDGETDIRPSRLLKAGTGTTKQAYDTTVTPQKPIATRWGDLAGASVDFVGGKEAAGVWIVHEYAKGANDGYGVHVGKVLGTAYPNLDLSHLAPLPATVRPGAKLPLAATLTNAGDGTAPPTHVGVMLVSAGGAVPLGSFRVARLRAGHRARLQFDATLPADLAPGAYRIVLTADPSGRVREYSDADNSVSGVFAIPAPPAPPGSPPPPPPPPPPPASPPNLAIAAATAEAATIVNNGGSPAGVFEVLVNGAGAFSIPGLGPGERSTIRFNSPCSRTVRSFTVNADARNQVLESDETDNIATVRCP